MFPVEFLKIYKYDDDENKDDDYENYNNDAGINRVVNIVTTKCNFFFLVHFFFKI